MFMSVNKLSFVSYIKPIQQKSNGISYFLTKDWKVYMKMKIQKSYTYIIVIKLKKKRQIGCGRSFLYILVKLLLTEIILIRDFIKTLFTNLIQILFRLM